MAEGKWILIHSERLRLIPLILGDYGAFLGLGLVSIVLLKLEFEEKKLYGETVEDENALRSDCNVYKLSNETRTGRI